MGMSNQLLITQKSQLWFSCFASCQRGLQWHHLHPRLLWKQMEVSMATSLFMNERMRGFYHLAAERLEGTWRDVLEAGGGNKCCSSWKTCYDLEILFEDGCSFWGLISNLVMGSRDYECALIFGGHLSLVVMTDLSRGHKIKKQQAELVISFTYCRYKFPPSYVLSLIILSPKTRLYSLLLLKHLEDF